MKKIATRPRAASLIESMRDLGYSLEAALADIIDNSISASAKNVDIHLEANEDPSICIIDDGHGMNPRELVEAMRLGCISPLDQREDKDLGRFGLGLKTASFSQGRRLTVLTKKNEVISGACWDLDDVVKQNEWLLHILDGDEIGRIRWGGRLKNSGTVVLWEKLDRLVDRTSGANIKDHLYEKLDVARKYLSLVFHRFMQGEAPLPKLELRINEGAVTPFDPFNSRHPSTQHLPEEVHRIDRHKVRIQAYILPHHKKCTKSEYDHYAGEGGYLKNQGFYVYRNGRLIIHRTWFRIVKQSELTRLARVRVDIPSGLDHLWKIDVRKATAQPPFAVRESLKKIVERITGASGRVYVFKGKKLVGPKIQSLWIRKAKHGGITYEINRDHPLLMHFMEMIGEEETDSFNAVLRAVEQCFPVDAFFADAAGNSEDISSNVIPEDVMEKLLDITIDALTSQGLSIDEILGVLGRTDPYRLNMEMVRTLLDNRENAKK
ncbi:MAG: ATP-binding protein [Deltaproteobacteria bacterium]|nr:ATP-binding protein [Deltaproteobacteria bacterium]